MRLIYRGYVPKAASQTCLEQVPARSCSEQLPSAAIAQSQANSVMLMTLGSIFGAVLVGVVVDRMYRQYRVRLLRQQIEVLERAWQKINTYQD